MLRFIYICMGVVVLSVLSIAGQSAFTGIDDSYQSVLERNEPRATTAIAATAATSPDQTIAIAPVEATASDLNDIETAAGGADGDGFGAPFADRAPTALADTDPAPPSAETAAPDAF